MLLISPCNWLQPYLIKIPNVADDDVSSIPVSRHGYRGSSLCYYEIVLSLRSFQNSFHSLSGVKKSRYFYQVSLRRNSQTRDFRRLRPLSETPKILFLIRSQNKIQSRCQNLNLNGITFSNVRILIRSVDQIDNMGLILADCSRRNDGYSLINMYI